MSTRDARGRFVNADEGAATRLLEAAVRRAVEDLQAIVLTPTRASIGYKSPVVHNEVVAMLANAATAADLLLSERAS